MSIKKLPQATGATSELIIGQETEFAIPAPPADGVKMRFISEEVAETQELNQSEVIRPDRNADEPFEGNGTVSGNITMATDVNLFFEMLKMVFGAPETTAPADGKAITAIADNSASVPGTVKFTATSHGVAKGGTFVVCGTENYDGGYVAVAVTTNDIIAYYNNYVAETPGANAIVSATGYTHVFTVKDKQPSFTLEKVYRNIAASRLLLGCKVNSIQFGANTDGQENQTVLEVVGSRPGEVPETIELVSVADDDDKAKFTTASAHGLSVGDVVVISGTAGYDGRQTVTAATDDTFTVNAAYVAETWGANAKPAASKVHFIAPRPVRLARVSNFGATVYEDDAVLASAKDFQCTINFGLDTDQRTLADQGWVGEIPEGTVTVECTMNLCYRSDAAYQAASTYKSVSLKFTLERKSSPEKVVVEIPYAHYRRAGVPISTAKALTQEVTAMGYSTNDNESIVTITVVNALAN